MSRYAPCHRSCSSVEMLQFCTTTPSHRSSSRATHLGNIQLYRLESSQRDARSPAKGKANRGAYHLMRGELQCHTISFIHQQTIFCVSGWG